MMEARGETRLSNALVALLGNPGNPEAVIADFEARADRLAAEAQALRQIVSGMQMLAGKCPDGIGRLRLIVNEVGVLNARTMLEELQRRNWDRYIGPWAAPTP